jgi:UDPglucose 6-dehydrogenase
LVKVTARIDQGEAFSTVSSQAIRRVSTRVLPLPAPASTRNDPGGAVTASRWGSLRSSRIQETSMVGDSSKTVPFEPVLKWASSKHLRGNADVRLGYSLKEVMMKITIFGSGYVGLVTGACFADVGNDVMCVDVDPRKVEMLQRGEIPIHEPGLDDVVRRNGDSGRLRFTTDLAAGVAHGLFQFIAVGTPPDEDGSADLAARPRRGPHHWRTPRWTRPRWWSTNPPCRSAPPTWCAALAAASAGTRPRHPAFEVVSNPEFLKEGAAVADCLRPDRIIIGTTISEPPCNAARALCPLQPQSRPMIVMDVRSRRADQVRRQRHAGHQDQLHERDRQLAEALGADIECRAQVGIGADPRIGYHFIYPGCGYGGSCFPKDVKALCSKAVEAVNERQKNVLFTKIQHHFVPRDLTRAHLRRVGAGVQTGHR